MDLRLRRLAYAFVVLAAATLSFASGALAQEWNLADEFRFSPNQENPSRDDHGNPRVWHYLQGPDTTPRNPATYDLLTRFDTTTQTTNQRWQSGSTSANLFVGAFNDRSAAVFHPDVSNLTIAGWRSPISGVVDIEGSFTDGDLGGGGISWFIDKGATNLLSGGALNPTERFARRGVSVAPGDFLYFIVSSNGDANFDTTLADINISLPEPALGKTAVARVVRGEVLIGIPSRAAGHAAQKGIDFVPLEETREIPMGSFLDTTNGTVALTTAKSRAGKTQSGRFSAGLFQVLQSRKAKAKGLTELRMKGSAARFRSCRNGRRASAALSRRTIRRLRANAKGRYRSRGRHSAATVRGTRWVMEDRCDGTLTKVKRGKVAVRDFRLKKTVVLTAGKSYLAAAAGTSNLFRIP